MAALPAATTARRTDGAALEEAAYGDVDHMEEGKREVVEDGDGGDDAAAAQAMAARNRMDNNEAAAEEVDDDDDGDEAEEEEVDDETPAVVMATCPYELFSPSIPGHYSQRNNCPRNMVPEHLVFAFPSLWRSGWPHNLAFFAK